MAKVKLKKAVGAAKKLHKKNPKLLYALVAVAVFAAIAVGVTYYLRPDLFDFGNKTPPEYSAALAAPVDGELSVYFLDIGQGDCAYIHFPDGKDMLIDCGSENGSSAYRASVQSDLGVLIDDGQLDYMMLTHGDQDHVDYLDEVLNAYDVDNICMPNILAAPDNSSLNAEVAGLDAEKLALFTDEDKLTTSTYGRFFISALRETDANIIININTFSISGPGYTFDFWCFSAADWAEYDLSSAEEKNAISPIGILSYADRKIVFTGDSNEINEEMFLEDNTGCTDCDVLKVAHHGSESSSTSEFLDYVNCEYAVISVGSGNGYGHPAEEAVARLNAENMTVYRTDMNGNVSLVIKNDGRMSFALEKEAA